MDLAITRRYPVQYMSDRWICCSNEHRMGPEL